MKDLLKNLKQNAIFFLMVLPGVLWLILFFYIPVLGNVIAFKDYRHTGEGFIDSVLKSEWIGLDNFKFLFQSSDAYIITRNTLLYNLGFILLGLIFAVGIAIIFSEMRSKRLVKLYQTTTLFPYFLSWVIISFFVYAFLSPDKGLFNNLLVDMGMEPIQWYSSPGYWPFILLFLGIWKGLGYNSIIYYATIMGIDPSYYEAAIVDGASKWQRIRYVTIPQLLPLVTILTILAVGNIFRADFGLFYQIPKNSGPLFNVTQVLDTYVYRGIAGTGDIGMAIAAGLYQSIVGCFLVVSTNLIVRRFDKESALF
ncbi:MULTISPECIES: sugar ABC transporter permease [unclassified Streptococcus]|uniref:ABC transporter permease n=1 Tax=unclassified Streptococcus TaxID=2608887 RepID=UPI0018A88E5F|nr:MULTISPECIES: sugar ABC transporter permease [unclassified Streptococcus]MBF8970537.1 sugar ABC transporter permease [Streptococcus sp. NLN76]MBG9367617.1 sugar ABC transporter permease [Streptococcus sp. NLN64]MBJ6745265.1 sugar ABC transporter permease [Streptococcus sp. 121]